MVISQELLEVVRQLVFMHRQRLMLGAHLSIVCQNLLHQIRSGVKNLKVLVFQLQAMILRVKLEQRFFTEI